MATAEGRQPRLSSGHYDVTPELRPAVDAVLDCINYAKALRLELVDLAYHVDFARSAAVERPANGKRKRGRSKTDAATPAATLGDPQRRQRAVDAWVTLRDGIRKAGPLVASCVGTLRDAYAVPPPAVAGWNADSYHEMAIEAAGSLLAEVADGAMPGGAGFVGSVTMRLSDEGETSMACSAIGLPTNYLRDDVRPDADKLAARDWRVLLGRREPFFPQFADAVFSQLWRCVLNECDRASRLQRRRSGAKRTRSALNGKRRPAYERDHRWLAWRVSEGMTPARIRDRWNAMSDDERRSACPFCWQRIDAGEKGRGVVKNALRAAESEVPAKES